MTSSHYSQQYDVIVVGMGPAGASAAYELSRRGFSVLALEKQRHPRYKVCGGGLSARIANILPEDFTDIVEKIVHRVEFNPGSSQTFVIESSEPIAYMVMRERFDQWLLEKARIEGAEICEGEVVLDVQDTESNIHVQTNKGRYTSRVVIGADGVMSVVARRCFASLARPTIPALESEVPCVTKHPFQLNPTALISLQAAKKGYGWIFPKQHGLSVGVGEFVNGTRRPKQGFRGFVGRDLALAGLNIPEPLGYPLPLAHLFRSPTNLLWSGRLVRGRAMLVGDAGQLVDPLLGEGIYYAIRSGQLAAKSITAMFAYSALDRLTEYETLLEKEFGGEFHAAARLAKIVYGLPRAMHRWAGQRYPGPYQRVLHRYCLVLQGKETYQGLWNRILHRLYWPFVRKCEV